MSDQTLHEAGERYIAEFGKDFSVTGRFTFDPPGWHLGDWYAREFVKARFARRYRRRYERGRRKRA
jgi:hypothetical protein